MPGWRIATAVILGLFYFAAQAFIALIPGFGLIPTDEDILDVLDKKEYRDSFRVKDLIARAHGVSPLRVSYVLVLWRLLSLYRQAYIEMQYWRDGYRLSGRGNKPLKRKSRHKKLNILSVPQS